MHNPLGRRVAVASAAGAVLLAGAWWWTAGRTADDVHVTWTSGPECTVTEVRERQGRPTVDAVAGMRCTIQVEVRNDSGRTVRVGRAVAKFIGPETGTVVTADREATPEVRGAGGGLDAAYPLDVDLEAGERTRFRIVVRFHPEGCNHAVTIELSDWPTVEVEVLQRTFTLAAPQDFAFHRRGTTPGCTTS